MIVAVLLAANTIGSFPLLVGFFIKTAINPEIAGKLAENPSDFSVLGFDPNVGLIMMVVPFVAAIFTFILLVRPLHLRTFKQTINGTNSIRWSRFFISALVWTILSGLYLIIYRGIDPSNFKLNNTSVTLIYLVFIALTLIPFQATFEEVIFRGYLMQGFAFMAGNRWFPLLMTSLFFALMHGLNPEIKEFGFFTMMPQYLVFGLVFGIVSVLDDGIEVAMGAHTANNIFLCIFVTNSSSALQTPALYFQNNVYPWIEFIGLLVSSIIFIVVLAVILKWKDFSHLWGKVIKQTEPIQSV
jgi:membrane protease YdiL (CAAX protease family)